MVIGRLSGNTAGLKRIIRIDAVDYVHLVPIARKRINQAMHPHGIATKAEMEDRRS